MTEENEELPRTPNVLVVDDDGGIRDLISLALERAGWHVHVAEDGPAAVREAVTEPPDLVIVDVMLPGFDGLEAMNRIHVTNPEIPVLVVSARGSESDRVLGLDAGADDFLAKPFGISELTARCDALLRRAPLRRVHRAC